MPTLRRTGEVDRTTIFHEIQDRGYNAAPVMEILAPRQPKRQETGMRFSEKGAAFVRDYEKFEPKVYVDSAGVSTIGYGETQRKYIQQGSIDEPTARNLMNARINNEFAPYVRKKVKVPLTQNQFDAVVSFVYNLGPTQLEDSTFFKKLNKKDYKGAADEMLKWKGGGPGVIVRRRQERDMFLYGKYDSRH